MRKTKKLLSILLVVTLLISNFATLGLPAAAADDLLQPPAFPGSPSYTNSFYSQPSLPLLSKNSGTNPAAFTYLMALSGSGASVTLTPEGGEPLTLTRLNPVTASLNPGYSIVSSGTVATLYLFNQLFADAGARYTLVFKAPGYEDKVLDQYWEAQPAPLTADNFVTADFASDGGAVFRWSLRYSLDWSPYFSWEFFKGLNHISINGQKLYENDGYTIDATYSYLTLEPVYGLSVKEVVDGVRVNRSISMDYSEVLLVMNNGATITLSEAKPGAQAPPALTQDNHFAAMNSPYPQSSDYRAVWRADYSELTSSYSFAVYAATVDGVEVPRLNQMPDETNPAPGFYVSERELVIGVNPFEGEHDLVVKARGYADLEIPIRNDPTGPFNIFAPGFRLGILYANGLVIAPEGVDDSPTGDIQDYYKWDLSKIRGLPYLKYNDEVKAYFDSITGIRAYTDRYPGGKDLEKVSESNVQLPYGAYSYAISSVRTEANGALNGPWSTNFYIRTNGAFNTSLDDPAADKINRLVLTATGYDPYDVSFTHGTKKFPISINSVSNVIRDEDTNKLNVANMVFTFAPNAEFESGITNVQLIWEGGVKSLTSAQYSVASGSLTLDKEVFEDAAVPVMATVFVSVSSDGYMDSAAQQMIQSTNPYAFLRDKTLLTLQYPGKVDYKVSEKELYNFMMQHNGFYSVQGMISYVIDGKLVYPGAIEPQAVDESTLGQKYYYCGVRKGGPHVNFLGVDVVELYWEKMGVDLYALARDPGAPNFTISTTAADNYSGGFIVPALRAEAAYYSGGVGIPQPSALITFEYDGGTLLQNCITPFDIGSASRYMLYNSKNTGANGTITGGGMITVRETGGSKTKSPTPVLAKVGDTTVTGTENIAAFTGDVLTINGGAGDTMFCTIAWDGAIPADPTPSCQDLYNANRNLFDRGGSATVKLMAAGVTGVSTNAIYSDVATYTFNVGKQYRISSPRNLTSPQPGEVFGTTGEMEYHTNQAATEGWSPAGELSTYVQGGATYYFRYAESGRYYASATVAVAVAKTDKQFQSVPPGLTGVMPIIPDGQGTISGTTSAMEYSINGNLWTTAGDGATSALPGAYYVRLAATATHLPSSSVQVTVPVYVKDYSGILLEVIDRRGGKNETHALTSALAGNLVNSAEYRYTTVNTFGTPKVYDGMEGFALSQMFEALGLEVSEGDLVQFISSDNYNKTVLWDYLTADRYYYPNLPNTFVDGQAPATAYLNPAPVPAIIALNYGEGTVMFGQRAPHEQTNDVFIQNMTFYDRNTNRIGEIILYDGNHEKFPAITSVSPANQATVSSGAQVTITNWASLLGYSDGYIYYTTDGSEPGLNSRLFNYNTYNGAGGAVFRPTISAADADPYTGIVTLKLKVFGQAKYPSDTTIFTYYVENFETAVPTVTFIYNDGVTANREVTVETGATVEQPGLPIRNGWVFQGWLLEGAPYDFGAPVTRDLVLSAAWKSDSGDLLFEVVDVRDGGNKTYQVREEMGLFATKGGGYHYSAVNTFGSPDDYSEDYNGPQLALLFEALGLNLNDSDLVQIVGSDGFNNTARWDWLNAERKYYPFQALGFSEGQASSLAYTDAVSVPAIVAMEYDGGTFMFGQLAPHEQTKNVFVKKILYDGTSCGRFVIMDGNNDCYPAISAVTPASGLTVKDGATITFDGVERQPSALGFYYYTTDGSEPTLQSKLYNYNSYDSGNLDGGEVKKPVISAENANPYTGEVTLKVKVFGIAKLPSATATFTYKVEDYAVVVPTVTFVYGDGATPDGVTQVNAGELAVRPADPVWTDNQFLGWYNGADLFDFNTPITADLTLNAAWADGSADAPFQIADMAGLRWMSEMVNGTATRTVYRTKYYELTADIVYDGAGFTPIGGATSTYSFNGGFDGQGYTIAGLTLNGAGNLGLFAYLTGTVKNLGLTDVAISGTGNNIGGITGQATGQSGGRAARIENSYVTGWVSGSGATGGIAGSIGGSDSARTAVMLNCYFSGAVTASTGAAGGLTGESTAYARLENCYTLGTVSGGASAGGLAGQLAANVTITGNLALNQSVAATNRAARAAGYLNGGAVAGCYAWEDMVVDGAITNAGADGTGVSKEILSESAGWPVAFRATPWLYTAGLAPVLNGLNGQDGTFPAYLRTSTIIKGDLTGDGEIDIFDVQMLLNQVYGISQLNEDAALAADVNGDGEIDIFDVQAILNHIYGIKLLAS